MKNNIIIGLIGFTCFFLYSFDKIWTNENPEYQHIIDRYKTDISQWPPPFIDLGVNWTEMQSIKRDSLYFENQNKPEVILGKMLFFDPKLSKSEQISCSSCHDPEMGWTDRRRVALGHDHLKGKRNTP
ncbi:cytochrome-c peroxidase, partial [Myroides odoratimimus]|uniref:cytochrome-c peroxidase n=1 Tax=Myroides odoratimimus TaxID=76832 RepID=UPI00310181BC